MAFLRIERGGTPGQLLEVTGDETVIGRHPTCQIVLDNASVSRRHARILHAGGAFELEDLGSRNRTYLNGSAVDGRRPLAARDRIALCDVEFRFHPGPEPPLTETLPDPSDRFDDAPDTAADLPVHRTPPPAGGAAADRNEATNLSVRVQPEETLRAVLDITRSLASTLELDDVLDRTLADLFRIFPQADRGFVLLVDPGETQPRLHASRSRGTVAGEPRFSMTVVRRALGSGEAILTADAAADARFETSDSLADLQLRSVLCVPLHGREDAPFGVIQLDTADHGRQFGEDSLDLLLSLAAPIGLSVENARLHVAQIKQREVRRDLELATQIQVGFLPRKPPGVAGYEFRDYYESAEDVGGDYFDYVPLPDGRLAVALGDVAGKGVPAALLMARLFSAARFHLSANGTAADALGGLNRELASSPLGHRFITCVLCLLDPEKHAFTCANAGHMAPLVRAADGTVEPFEQSLSGLPIGIDPDQTFREAARPLAPGETVLVYTDGVTEAVGPDRELYGAARLTETLAGCDGSAADTVDAVVESVTDWTGDAPQSDDICLVAFRRLP